MWAGCTVLALAVAAGVEEPERCNPDLSQCADERFGTSFTACVSNSLAQTGTPTPFLPVSGGTPVVYKGRRVQTHQVAYWFKRRGPAQLGTQDAKDWVPFAADKHRALVLTQPKVGTGALIGAFDRVSDLIVRSHEVEFVLAEEPWVPFRGCRARPASGNCTVVHGIRDPRSWLASSYFQFRAAQLCGGGVTPEEAVRSYHSWLAAKENRAMVGNWWRIGDQLRAHGMAASDVYDFLKHVLASGGIGVLRPWALPNQRPWLHGCNVAVLQMEQMINGSTAEARMRELVPGFRFQAAKVRLGRSRLCPAAAPLYAAIKAAKVPQSLLNRLVADSDLRGQDFAQAVRLYESHNNVRGA